jgi:dihydrofolate reductase
MTQVGTFPHADKEAYVVTRSERPVQGNTQFYTGDLKVLVQQLKSRTGKNIFCDGGAEVVHELLKHQLIDELIISVIPVMVGEGTRLFKDGRPYQALRLVATQAFDTGLVQLHYAAL